MTLLLLCHGFRPFAEVTIIMREFTTVTIGGAVPRAAPARPGG